MTILPGRILIALAFVGAVWLYFAALPLPAPAGVHLPAAPAPELAGLAPQPLRIELVKVFAPEAKKKLKLPKAVQQDAGKHVVASTRTPADERSHTVTTVLDAATGEFASYDRAEALPWVAVATKSQVGAFYGFKNGEPTLRVQAQQELLQLKALRLGATASVDVNRDGVDSFVGVGAWARW